MFNGFMIMFNTESDLPFNSFPFKQQITHIAIFAFAVLLENKCQDISIELNG